MEKLSSETIKQQTGISDVFIYDTVGSTSDEAKRAFRGGMRKNAIFAAERQTAGRGRSGKSFYSPASTGLYFTVLLSTDASLSVATFATPAAAVAVCEALEELTEVRPSIKWVNDIFIGDKKVCGILTEALTGDSGALEALAVGIGINLSTRDFPAELSGIAASLGKEVDKNELLSLIYKKLAAFAHELSKKSFFDGYRDRLFVIGREVEFTQCGDIKRGTVKRLGDDFELIIDCADEEIVIRSGEISVKVTL